MAADWVAIKSEYVTTRTSMQKLAEKYGVSIDQMKKKAAAEKWRDGRTKTAQKAHQKIVRKVLEETTAQEADRIITLLAISDKLAEKINKAASDLGETYIVKRKTIAVEVDEETGEPRKVEETQDVAVRGDAIVCSADVRNLAAALKNIWDVMQPEQGKQATEGGLSVSFEGALKEAAE